MGFSNFKRKKKLLLSGLIALLENLLLNFPLKPAAQSETNYNSLHLTFSNLSRQEMGNTNVDSSESSCVHADILKLLLIDLINV